MSTSSESPLSRLMRMDLFLLSCFGLILGIGMIFIASASRDLHNSGGSAGLLLKQGIFVGIGLACFFALQRISYLSILRTAPLLYLVGLGLLCGVLKSRPIGGASCWYNLYFFNFQPSEIMKPILVLTLAHYLMYRDSYKKLTGLFVPLVLAMVPMVLILKEPDLGTFLALAPVLLVMLFAAGARWPHLFLMVFCGMGGMTGMWFTVVKDYQKRRVLAWLNPDEYSHREAWQLIHSETAIGSGGFWGKGWGASGHDGINVLPEKHTDFIFSIVAEEGGFFVATLLLLLFLFAILAALGIAERTREPAGRLIVVGCITMFCSQVLINLGVTLGLLPTTGLTLPFVSYGGSSVICTFITLGLIANVSATHVPVLAREDFG